ncbi:major pollen allergen Ole e 10-like [Juglans microcarpa x Juglans regia]|uniref:major pollen allergen Ole e 10-like n=1 Tax=Juglans microcarpa x Juglans regia TaxID=2249226 RepID=UPI001B7E26D9|nr:major pollen allergen Ole e 10-like [Juglans microcarpa x Juglans regia]
MKMKIARGTLAIILSLALAFLLSFAACSESRTHVNEKRLQVAFSRSHLKGKKLQPAKVDDKEAVLSSDRTEKGSTTNTWCIAKPSTNNDKLLHNVEYSCGEDNVDCQSIQLGGSCFHPNNAVSHASFAMNLFYQDSGKHPWNCDFNGTGLIVSDNPSFGKCQYPA